jgi:hypothetical protein
MTSFIGGMWLATIFSFFLIPAIWPFVLAAALGATLLVVFARPL